MVTVAAGCSACSPGSSPSPRRSRCCCRQGSAARVSCSRWCTRTRRRSWTWSAAADPARPPRGATPTPGATTSACWWSGSWWRSGPTRAASRRGPAAGAGLPGGVGRPGRLLAQPWTVDRPRRGCRVRRPALRAGRPDLDPRRASPWPAARSRWRCSPPRSAVWSAPGSTTASPTASARSSSTGPSTAWPSSPVIGYGSTRNTIGGRNSITVGESSELRAVRQLHRRRQRPVLAGALRARRRRHDRVPGLLRLRAVAVPP